MCNDATVCIGIPTYNRDQVLVDTIKYILRLNPLPNEIVVVDQTKSHNSLVDQALADFRNLDIFKYYYQEDPNLPAARNRILTESISDVVIFIDDDVIPDHDTFCNDYLEVFKRHPEAVGVAGKVIEDRSLPVTSSSAYQKYPSKYDYFNFKFDAKQEIEVCSMKGCNHAIKRNVALRLGGYDTNYSGRALREETDMAIRIYGSGGHIIYSPKCSLFHLAAPSGGCRALEQSAINEARSRAASDCYFLFKHFSKDAHFVYVILFNHLKQYIFTRKNILKPWRLPLAAIGYLFAFCEAYRMNR